MIDLVYKTGCAGVARTRRRDARRYIKMADFHKVSIQTLGCDAMLYYYQNFRLM